MLKITKDEDIMGLCMDDYARPFLLQHLHGLQNALEMEDIEDYGAIYLIESAEDWARYDEIGLAEPFEDSPVEWIRRIEIGDECGKKTYYCACVVMNNEFAVSIVFGDNVVEVHMRRMMEELLEGVDTEIIALEELMKETEE